MGPDESSCDGTMAFGWSCTRVESFTAGICPDLHVDCSSEGEKTNRTCGREGCSPRTLQDLGSESRRGRVLAAWELTTTRRAAVK